MRDSESSPDTTRAPPHDSDREGRRRRLESVIPEIVRRVVELGVEKARESPDSLKQLVADLKLPKEIAHYLLQQIDDTKNGVFRVVAKEMRDFLEHTNFAKEMQKILTTVKFEIHTTIRFAPNDDRESQCKDDEGDDAESTEKVETESTGEPHGNKRQRTMPRPEVKTAVHLGRDERRQHVRDFPSKSRE